MTRSKNQPEKRNFSVQVHYIIDYSQTERKILKTTRSINMIPTSDLSEQIFGFYETNKDNVRPKCLDEDLNKRSTSYMFKCFLGSTYFGQMN